MSYLLEFPPSTLPVNIRSPPYVIFGLNGTSITHQLPSCIPLNVVLHFAPKFAQWLLPRPTNLPAAAAQDELHNGPYIGIDIRADIGVAGLQCIIFKIMDAAGHAVSTNLFLYKPSLITSVSIRRTWLMLELPPAGLDNLHIHLQTLIMTGPPPTLDQMKALWDNFPPDAEILGVMAAIFVQAHILLLYNRTDFEDIRKWYHTPGERFEVFRKAVEKFPDYGMTHSLRSSRRRGHKVNNDHLERLQKDIARIAEQADQEKADRDMERPGRRRKSKRSKVWTDFERAKNAEQDISKTMGRKSGSNLKEAAAMSAELSEALSKVYQEQETGNTLSER